MQIPQSIDYSQMIKPRGIQSSFKRWEVLPQTSYNTDYQMSEQIRFQFKTSDFIDPYQSYIEIEVVFDENDYIHNGYPPSQQPQKDIVPSFHLDGPATSLISEMILSSNMKEIERVQEYDQIGNLMSDLGMEIGCKQNRGIEGYKFAKFGQSQDQYVNDSRDLTHPKTVYTSTGGIMTEQDVASPFFTRSKGLFNQIVPYTGSATTSLKTQSWFSQIELHRSVDSIQYSDATSLIANYLETLKSNHSFEQSTLDTQFGVQHTKSNTCGLYGTFNDDDATLTNINNERYKSSSDPKAEYLHAIQAGFLRNKSIGSQYNICDKIAPFFPTAQIVNGKYVKTQHSLGSFPIAYNQDQKNLCQTKKTYYVPILSTVIGTLIPSDQWKLIPGDGLGELMFEFRFNRHAFFASGHKLSAYDKKANPAKLPINEQWDVKWKIGKISMHFDLWNFGDEMKAQVQRNLNSGDGIILTGQGFTQGPIQTVSNTQNVQNNWQINNGISSLKQMWVWFLSNDYLKYSYCRKNFKLSHNLRELQLKFGQEFVPQQPIRGNAGQLYKNNHFKEDYTEFYTELQRSVGAFFSCSKPIQISPEQFVLNERCYDVSSFGDTWGQQCIHHEERAKGQAIYCLDMVSDPHDNSVLSGVNTVGVRPFELQIKVNNDLMYNGDQTVASTMYVFLQHDVLVQYRLGGVETAGWG